MSKPNRTDPSLRQTLESHLHHVEKQLEQADPAALARQSGFLQRSPRKIPILKLALALVALAAESVLSLERVAAVISLAAGLSYSKQALHQRLSDRIDLFWAQLATALVGQLSSTPQNQGWFKAFERLLLHDSTVEPLPDHLANVFPGPGNGRNRRFAALKLQFICDLLHSQVLRLRLSGFQRNDQAASPDILSLAQAGDLIIRDLGYFVIQVLEQLSLKGAYFLSRYRHGVLLYDPATGQLLPWAKVLRPGQSLDRNVLLGQEQWPVRRVALPVPEAVANERCRKARNNRDRRLHPSAQKLYLLGWNIFVTHVPRTVWPAQALGPIYRLRWRIEMIFKAWKSHLRLRELNCRAPTCFACP